MKAGATDEELKDARSLKARAPRCWDYVAANNGMGFHSPQECMRILAAAVDLGGQCRLEAAGILARHGVTQPVQYPQFDTKEKAMATVKQFVDGQPPNLIKGK